MPTSQQKELCIKLYTERNHTIKDILSQTGLKYAPEIYQILDEAGIPRKRRIASKEQNNQTVNIEASRTKFLSSMCRLYHNEPENPYTEDEPFKQYMWRNEWKIMQDANDPRFIESRHLDDPRNWSSFFNDTIRFYIERWTDRSKRERPNQWFSKYYDCK